MDSEARRRFQNNIEWFNEFFDDLGHLFGKIGNALIRKYDLRQPGFYYPKRDSIPRMPEYYGMGMGGQKYSVQVFALLDSTFVEAQKHLEPEPSIVVVLHSDSEKPMHFSAFGLKVLSNKGIRVETVKGGVYSGYILQEEREIPFSAKQISLAAFTGGNDLTRTIEAEIFPMIDEYRNRLPY